MLASLRGSVGMGTKEDESSTGCIWAAVFHHIMARSRLARVLKLNEPFISLIFQIFSGCGKPQITETVGMGVCLYIRVFLCQRMYVFTFNIK